MRRFTIFVFVAGVLIFPSYAYADIFSDIGAFLNTIIGKEQEASVSVSVSTPIRRFILDTKGKNIKLEGDNKGVLTEVSDAGNYIRSWDIEYEKKGNSRDSCNPPVLNLKFDKKDKKNQPKPLFNGMTTFFGRDSLNYQKIRLVPDCEIWESTQFIAPTGINVLLKEYFIYSLFRSFGVPTPDVVAFGSILFNSTDTNFDKNKEYKYLMLQRSNEPDDQIPLLSQYNLSELVEASGAGKTSSYQKTGDHFFSIHYEEGKIKKDIKLDPENAIRYFLLSDFVNLNDHFLFQNEDYGKDKSTGLWKTVPFDFDMSFDCGLPVTPAGIEKELEKLSLEEKIKYKNIYYKISREIFDNPESLNKMLSIVDRFPFIGNKEPLKNYIRVAFYNYALYFGLPEFSNYIGKTHIPFINEESNIKAVESIKNINTLNQYCDNAYKTRINNSLTSYSNSKIKPTQLKSVVTNNPSMSMVEVSPFYSFVFSPSSAIAGSKVILYWRGAVATDIESLITFKSKMYQFTLKSKSRDGISFELILPSIPDTYAGIYDVTVSNERFGASGSRTFNILVTQNSPPTEIPLPLPITPTISGTPNLIVNSISVNGSSTGVANQIYAGSMTIIGSITNNGTASSQAFTAKFQYSTNNDYFVDWIPKSVSALSQGQSQTLSYTWTGGTGIYYFRLCTADMICSSPVRVEIIANPSSSPISERHYIFFMTNIFEGIESLFK